MPLETVVVPGTAVFMLMSADWFRRNRETSVPYDTNVIGVFVPKNGRDAPGVVMPHLTQWVSSRVARLSRTSTRLPFISSALEIETPEPPNVGQSHTSRVRPETACGRQCMHRCNYRARP
jgi:hypothetical protein